MGGVNTGKAARRALRFATIDEALAEADRVAEADKAGRLTRTGNWSAGQVLGHLAAWASYPYEGYPGRKPPWFVRALVGRKKRKYLEEGLPAGVKIPGVPGGTHGIDALPTDEAHARFRAAFERLKRDDPPPHPSPVFGPLTMEEWRQLNLRHAELHLGFVRY